MSTFNEQLQARGLSTPMSQHESKKTRWLWAEQGSKMIPLGTTVMIAGKGGEGKSTLIWHLVAQVTNGTLPGDLYGKPGNVLILTPEDDPGQVTKPRLSVAGANLDRVFECSVKAESAYYSGASPYLFPRDVLTLEEQVKEHAPKVIVFDPITSMIQGQINSLEDVRGAIMPIQDLAMKYGFTGVMVNHMNKGSGQLSNRAQGSTAFRDVARAYFVVAKDRDDGAIVIEQDKNNYGGELSTWEFTIQGAAYTADDGSTDEVGRVTGLQPSDRSVTEIVNRAPDETTEDRNEVEQYILDTLRQQEGYEMPASAIMEAGYKEMGYSRERMRKARQRCKNPWIASKTVPGGKATERIWAIEETPPQEKTLNSKSSVTRDSVTQGHGGNVTETENPGNTRNLEESAQHDTGTGSVVTLSRCHAVTLKSTGKPHISEQSRHDISQTDSGEVEECPLHRTTPLPGCYTCDKIRERQQTEQPRFEQQSLI